MRYVRRRAILLIITGDDMPPVKDGDALKGRGAEDIPCGTDGANGG